MISRRGRSTLSILGACVWMGVGCGGSQAKVPTGETASALDEQNGGITAGPEQPAFGDPNVENLPDFSSAFSDAVDENSSPADAGSPLGSSYHLALLWGHLPPPHDADDSDTVPQPMDFSGTVSVDNGLIGVKRTLQFDQGDHVDPRTDPKVVAFSSHTLPFVDGLFLHVTVPDGASTAVHFHTVSLSTDIDLAQLPLREGGIVRLADDRNGLVYVGYKDDAGCAKGIAMGRWIKERARFGRLRGHVIDSEGETIGHLRGLWGHAVKRDKDVFFAKYIGTDGDDRGLVVGRYDNGMFAGLWATRDESQVGVGVTSGFYSDGLDKDDGRGLWIGRWSEKCER